jgi:tRNA nucleotidyltransferase/poly(A) polymerase
MVRDLLLGKEPVDIDLVIEDDIKSMADSLNRKLKGECLIYPEFGTATIRVGTEQIDLARARTETYPLPAHLPVVRFSNLDKDFSRRDFTVNAVALSLSRKDFGRIIDPLSGIRDIRGKSIRVLHDRSFIDDPTRIFRALRYKNRLGFMIERDTDRLMKNAIRGKMIGRLSGHRVLGELRLITQEKSWRLTLRDLDNYGTLRFTKRDLDLMDRLDDLKIYYLLGKFQNMKLPMTRKEIKLAAELVRIPGAVRRLHRHMPSSELYRYLSPMESETIAAIPSLDPSLAYKIRKFRLMKKILPIVTGRDLIRAGLKPGPAYRNTLRRLFYLQLDGKLRKKEPALKKIIK